MVNFKFTAQLFLAGGCPGRDSYPKPFESKATLHCARGIIPKPFYKRQAIRWVNAQYSRLGVVCAPLCSFISEFSWGSQYKS